MRVKKWFLGLIPALVLAGVLGTATPASSYCDPGWDSGSGCSNSCTEMARTWEKITRRPAPWLCPM